MPVIIHLVKDFCYISIGLKSDPSLEKIIGGFDF